MASIENLIEDASYDMFNPKLNFEIAKKYEELGQTASASSFYLRAAEYGHDNDPIIVYSSLLRMAFCFEDQNNREHTVSGLLLQAIQYMPTRPEAYFLLSRFFERTQKWQECYTFAEMGMLYTTRLEKLPAEVEYPGVYALLFEKAVSGWYLGRKEESKQIFLELLEQDIPEGYRNGIKWNVDRMGTDVTV